MSASENRPVAAIAPIHGDIQSQFNKSSRIRAQLFHARYVETLTPL